jgi:hypothetical protein
LFEETLRLIGFNSAGMPQALTELIIESIKELIFATEKGIASFLRFSRCSIEKKNMPVLRRWKPLQDLFQRLHWQSNDVGQTAFLYLNVRIVIFLNSVSAGTAFPPAGSEIVV